MSPRTKTMFVATQAFWCNYHMAMWTLTTAPLVLGIALMAPAWPYCNLSSGEIVPVARARRPREVQSHQVHGSGAATRVEAQIVWLPTKSASRLRAR